MPDLNYISILLYWSNFGNSPVISIYNFWKGRCLISQKRVQFTNPVTERSMPLVRSRWNEVLEMRIRKTRHTQMFCDKHNDDSQCLMLLPTSQLSIPITLLFVNIAWWWRLGGVSVSNVSWAASCVAQSHQLIVAGKLKILISSSLASRQFGPRFRSRDHRIIRVPLQANQGPAGASVDQSEAEWWQHSARVGL